MDHDSNRSRFIRGDFRGRPGEVRPPWSVSESRFIELCTHCNDCITDCPKAIIKSGSGQYPIIDFTHSGCDFCQKCVDICKTGALKKEKTDSSTPWSIKAVFLDSCLSVNGVVCRSCSEICESRAVRFQLKPGGAAQPILDQAACNGCGECLAVCPVKSIQFVEEKSVREQVA